MPGELKAKRLKLREEGRERERVRGECLKILGYTGEILGMLSEEREPTSALNVASLVVGFTSPLNKRRRRTRNSNKRIASEARLSRI